MHVCYMCEFIACAKLSSQFFYHFRGHHSHAAYFCNDNSNALTSHHDTTGETIKNSLHNQSILNHYIYNAEMIFLHFRVHDGFREHITLFNIRHVCKIQ